MVFFVLNLDATNGSQTYKVAPFSRAKFHLPRCSMYGIFTYIWVVLGINVGKYYHTLSIWALKLYFSVVSC